LVIYYEPGRTGLGDTDRSGRRSYIAVTRVQGVEADPQRADHFYALIEPGSFIAFDRPVPLHGTGDHWEPEWSFASFDLDNRCDGRLNGCVKVNPDRGFQADDETVANSSFRSA
jgi:hypothetical protein